MFIREASSSDLDNILSVERAAFGSNEEADLVSQLIDDNSAQPVLSLLAFQEELAVGHILFTRARLVPEDGVTISLLAPLAVVPACQRQGIGGRLIRRGLAILKERGIDLVFVLGHPAYYPRYGFEPAGKHGFDATYPIPEEHADAWMVQALQPGIIGVSSGKVMCADKLNQEKYWRE